MQAEKPAAAHRWDDTSWPFRLCADMLVVWRAQFKNNCAILRKVVLERWFLSFQGKGYVIVFLDYFSSINNCKKVFSPSVPSLRMGPLFNYIQKGRAELKGILRCREVKHLVFHILQGNYGLFCFLCLREAEPTGIPVLGGNIHHLRWKNFCQPVSKPVCPEEGQDC